jgi:hypothetical protein
MRLYRVHIEGTRYGYISAENLKQAKARADMKFILWEEIKRISKPVERKSAVLNKRQYVKKSDKIYNRKKSKKQLKKIISEED